MKKITFLFLTVLLTLASWRTSAQYFSDGFEGTFPSPWTHTQFNAAETWMSTTVSFHSGTKSIQCDYDASLGDQNEVMMSPVINLSSATAPRVRFWFLMSYYWGVSPNDNYDLKVEATTDGGANTTVLWTESQQGTFDNWTWYEVTVDLAAYAGQSNFQLILRYEGADGAQGNFDDVIVEETPTCPAPSTLTATNITTNSAELGWNSNGTTAWNVQYGVTGFALGSGTIVSTGTNPYTLTGLSATTNYQYYVQADCGTGGTSTWTGPFAFSSIAVTSAPYLEEFNTTTAPVGYNTSGWTIGSTRGVTGNPANNIYKNLWSSATTGTFTTINVDNIQAGMKLSFDYKLANYSSPYDPPASGSGNYTVSVSTDFGANYTVLETVANDGVAGWRIKNYDLTPYIGQVVKIKFVGTWISGDYDLAFDNIKIEVPPACPAPTALNLVSKTATSATFGWTAGASETQWDIEWGPEGFTQGTGTLVTGVTSNPYTLNGLTYGTHYSAYVRANCGAGSESTWVGPLTWRYIDAPDCATVVSPADGATGVTATGLITFEWAAATTGETSVSYNFYYGFTADAVTNLFNNFTTTTASASIGDYNTTLYWKIVPVNADGQEASGCPVWSFTTETPPGYCLTGDMYPFDTFEPSVCDGSTIEEICSDGWAGEYSEVALTANRTYEFSSSVATDFITISDATGTTPLVYGVSPVTYTPTADEIVRFYTHTDDQCGTENVDRSRLVMCDPNFVAPAPDCVTLVSPADGATGITASGNITFEWNAATTGEPAVSYNFYFGFTADAVTNLYNNFTTTNATAFMGAYNTTLYWKIVPVNSEGQEASGCPVWSFTTETPPGYCLTGSLYPNATFVSSVCDGTTVEEICSDGWTAEYSKVSLTANNTYEFSSSISTDFITISNEAGTTPIVYGLTPVTYTPTADEIVRFYTHADDQCSEDDLDRSRSVLCTAPASLSDNVIDGFSMYPNPVNNSLNLKALNNIDAISIYNMLGQELMRVNPSSTQVQLDMTQISIGSYVVKVQSGAQVGAYSLIKQ